VPRLIRREASTVLIAEEPAGVMPYCFMDG
jgi:hypothetical protein